MGSARDENLSHRGRDHFHHCDMAVITTISSSAPSTPETIIRRTRGVMGSAYGDRRPRQHWCSLHFPYAISDRLYYGVIHGGAPPVRHRH